MALNVLAVLSADDLTFNGFVIAPVVTADASTASKSSAARAVSLETPASVPLPVKAPFSPVAVPDDKNLKFKSITAMEPYHNITVDELRWKAYAQRLPKSVPVGDADIAPAAVAAVSGDGTVSVYVDSGVVILDDDTVGVSTVILLKPPYFRCLCFIS